MVLARGGEMKFLRIALNAAIVVAVAAGCANAPEAVKPAPDGGAAPAAARPVGFTVIPADRDADLKLYYADGRVVTGISALANMQQDAKLILWVAGNQFFAMDDVIAEFQKQVPKTNVGIVTLPPGLMVSAIESGGWRYNDRDYPGLPDVYASVSAGHLQDLLHRGYMHDYLTYMHNELVLLVAKGNPKGIHGIDDLNRADVRTSMPNPVNEGIMQFYGRKVLERHGLWQTISAGRECAGCQTTANNWFTAVHHRETPDRILAGASDTGLVWATEAQEARRLGKDVEEVKLPPEDSLRDEAAYAIGALTRGQRQVMAARYLLFVAGPAAQAAYAKHGFVRASPYELGLKPIP
jgi:ABC-type molybdate transport system substrate-binding protein